MKKIKELGKLIILGFLILIVFTIIFSFFDYTHFGGINKEQDKNLTNKIFNRFYYAVTTLSSAGYGDIVPKSNILKMISILLQFILIISLMSGFITIL